MTDTLSTARPSGLSALIMRANALMSDIPYIAEFNGKNIF